MNNELKQAIEDLCQLSYGKQESLLSVYIDDQDHYRIVQALTRMLEVAVRQRNYWSQYAGEYLQNKHLNSDDAEIIAAGRGEG